MTKIMFFIEYCAYPPTKIDHQDFLFLILNNVNFGKYQYRLNILHFQGDNPKHRNTCSSDK